MQYLYCKSKMEKFFSKIGLCQILYNRKLISATQEQVYKYFAMITEPQKFKLNF